MSGRVRRKAVSSGLPSQAYEVVSRRHCLKVEGKNLYSTLSYRLLVQCVLHVVHVLFVASGTETFSQNTDGIHLRHSWKQARER